MTDLDDYVSPPDRKGRTGFFVLGMKHAANSQSWALGTQQRNGFHVRRVVWGKLMARAEKRPGEEIRRASILVKGSHSR